MGKKSGPKPPDPVQTAEMQMRVNREAALDNARMSQIGQTTPFGRTFYTGNLLDGSRQQHTEIHPLLNAIIFGAGPGGGKGGRPMGPPMGGGRMQPPRLPPPRRPLMLPPPDRGMMQ